MNREDLERRFDGPIPAHLLRTQTAHDLQTGHHEAMIRFSESRIQDFTESLGRLFDSPPSPDREAWITRTRSIITDHESQIATHRKALATLPADAP